MYGLSLRCPNWKTLRQNVDNKSLTTACSHDELDCEIGVGLVTVDSTTRLIALRGSVKLNRSNPRWISKALSSISEANRWVCSLELDSSKSSGWDILKYTLPSSQIRWKALLSLVESPFFRFVGIGILPILFGNLSLPWAVSMFRVAGLE